MMREKMVICSSPLCSNCDRDVRTVHGGKNVLFAECGVCHAYILSCGECIERVEELMFHHILRKHPEEYVAAMHEPVRPEEMH